MKAFIYRSQYIGYVQKKADEHVQFISKEGLDRILYIDKHGA